MPAPQALRDAFAALPWQPPSLQTERLCLRALRAEDDEAIFDYASRPVVTPHVSWPPHRSLADTHDFLGGLVLTKYRQGEPEPFGIERLAEPGRVIGTVGVFWVSEAQREMELGYALHPDFWGQGIMAEAAAAAVRYTFEHYPVWRLRCRCRVENPASLRVMEKVGFRHEGIARGSVWCKGEVWDMHMTALVRSDLPGLPQALPTEGPWQRPWAQQA